MKGFFVQIAALAAPWLLKQAKQHMQGSKNPLTNLRQKYKLGKGAARFIYRRGLNKGQRQGRQQERQHLARRLLKMGYKPDIVGKMTGLSKRELEQL